MRDRYGRALVVAGSVVLIASAVLHGIGGFTVGFPALRASNLAPALQAGFRVVFLSLGWHWIVLAVIALVAGLSAARLRKLIVLICGLALLIEAAAGASMMGLFLGNELVGAAGVLLLCGGLLLDQTSN